ncbi:MAG TPA: recombinase family protein [Hanamia sp.]
MKDLKDIKKNIIKEIESGIWKNYYLVYNRKSTDEPENQKNSIAYQKSENTRFAFKQNFPIAKLTIEGFCTDGIISEKHSAFKEDTDMNFGNNGLVQYRIDRPKFYKLIQLLNHGYFKGVIVLCWDRISRNKGDETVVRKLMKTGIDFKFVLATYDKTSSGALHMDIDGMFAEHHSRVTSEKVSLNIFNQREKGICVYKAPVGYLNPGSMENKPFDPVRAPMIKKLFEMYSTGNWTLNELAKFTTEQGFTMPASRRKRTPEEMLMEEEDDILLKIEPVNHLATYTSIQKILTNQFYTGRIIGNNRKIIKSNSHLPLISDELFNKVQDVLSKKKISTHYVKRIEYPLRGIIRCGGCQRLYTPYEKKGILYFSSRCAKNCANKHKCFNISFITAKILKLMEDLHFTDNELEEFNNRFSTDIALFETKRFNQLEINERQKKKLREDMAYLRENRLTLLKTGVYTPEGLVEEESTLNSKIVDLQEKEVISDISMHETFKDVVILSELIKDACVYYYKANSFEKQDIIRIIFSELTLFNNELKYKCRNGCEALERRFVLSGDPSGWLSEMPSLREEINESINELKIYLNTHSPPICLN